MPRNFNACQTALRLVRVTRLLAIILAMGVPASALAAFGLTTAASYYKVDTGAGLVFKVRRTDNGSSTQSAGDIMSLVYNGVEYQNTSKGTQVNSGFDFLYNGVSAVTVSATTINTNYIKITVVAGNLTHYYMARNGYPHIYMATYFTTEPDTLGLCRYIVRIPQPLLPYGPVPSDIHLTSTTVESSDIFGMPDGTTRSKHYSNMRLKDWSYIGATGTNVGVWMVRDNNEGNSGGPFYRSLLNQCGSDQEITYIVNYGEAQTEAYRTGILNSYTLVFTNGATPGAVDTSWFSNMALTGYIGSSARGAVTCSGISNRDLSYTYTIGFSNTTAQYWTTAAASNGSFTMSGMIPGTYTMTVYKNELAVYSSSVSVAAAATTTVSPITISADPSYTVPLWRIGNWDGTPAEFLNGDKITYMHPSDVRISTWNPGTYVVGVSSPATGIPCYQWKDVNANQVVQFTLTAAQLAASTIRVGITTAYAGGRPNISVNSWTATLQNPSTQPDSRTLTIGSYRGNNATYTFNVPASALVAGTNTLTIYPISGTSGSGYLSPGYSLDCIDIYQGAAQTLAVPDQPKSVVAAAGTDRLVVSWAAVAGATSYNIHRATTSGGPYTTIATGVTSANYVDSQVSAGTTYYYIVDATNSSGTGPSSSEVAAVRSASTLISYLKFDESTGTIASDATGNNWNGALNGGASWASGKFNNAISLNGTNGYISLPSGLMSGVTDFTVMAWVKLNSVTSWTRVFDFGSGTSNYMFFTPQNSFTGKPRFAINTGGGEQQINTSTTIASGTWTHIAITLSGSTGTLYVNGTSVGTNTAMTLSPTSLATTTQNYIGKSQFSTDPYLNGSVDDFQIYSRALTAAEITAIATPPVSPDGLMGIGGDSQVTLSWNASARATAYILKRGTASGQETTTVSSAISGTSFTDTGLTNGTTYYYVVAASNTIGSSGNSNETSAKPAQTFAQWIAAAFPGQNSAQVIGAMADPDHDGLGNLQEYFLGTRPNIADSIGAISSAPDGTGNVVLNYRMSKNTTAVSSIVQQSTDLVSWTNTGVSPVVVSDQGTYYLMRATVPAGNNRKLFLRLSITQ